MSARAFGRDKRLLSADNYSAVFNHADCRVSNASLLILARLTDLDKPRLGLVVSKKHLRHAVLRNRFKRIVRETFRNYQTQLAGCDVVVLARNGFNQVKREEQMALVEKSFTKLIKKMTNNSGSKYE